MWKPLGKLPYVIDALFLWCGCGGDKLWSTDERGDVDSAAILLFTEDLRRDSEASRWLSRRVLCMRSNTSKRSGQTNRRERASLYFSNNPQKFSNDRIPVAKQTDRSHTQTPNDEHPSIKPCDGNIQLIPTAASCIFAWRSPFAAGLEGSASSSAIDAVDTRRLVGLASPAAKSLADDKLLRLSGDCIPEEKLLVELVRKPFGRVWVPSMTAAEESSSTILHKRDVGYRQKMKFM